MISLFQPEIPALLPGHLPKDIIQGKMLALSLNQPYAALMLHGKKETRTWNTNYRGWVLLCSCLRPFPLKTVLEISGEQQYSRIQNTLEQSPYLMSFGKAFAIGYLADSRPMTATGENDCFVKSLPKFTYAKQLKNRTIKIELKPIERQLFVHTYTNVMPIQKFDWEGKQGWKILDEATKRKIIVEPKLT